MWLCNCFSLDCDLNPGVHILVDFKTVTFFIQGNNTWPMPCLAIWWPLWFECEYFHSTPSFLSLLGSGGLFWYLFIILRICLFVIWRDFLLISEPKKYKNDKKSMETFGSDINLQGVSKVKVVHFYYLYKGGLTCIIGYDKYAKVGNISQNLYPTWTLELFSWTLDYLEFPFLIINIFSIREKSSFIFK